MNLVLVSEVRGGPQPNKRLQLTPNCSVQSIRGTVLAAGTVPRPWRSAPLAAAERPCVGQRAEIRRASSSACGRGPADG